MLKFMRCVDDAISHDRLRMHMSNTTKCNLHPFSVITICSQFDNYTVAVSLSLNFVRTLRRKWVLQTDSFYFRMVGNKNEKVV
jgi:hypothetical protein